MAIASQAESSTARSAERPAANGSAETSALAHDVWSRPGSRYRVRATVLLAANVVLFAGVGCFAYWLRSGVTFAPSIEGYWDNWQDAFRVIPDSPLNLNSMLIKPISVLHVPQLIPIVGLLMAAMISIPILVALLYRFWASLPFVAVLAFLAMMPWLAVAVLVSCIMVTVPRLRYSLRFISALLGLIPVVVYLVFAARSPGSVADANFDPVDQIKFVAPWVLAIVASTVVFALVLAIARLVNYRPGAITPLLVTMFALPVVLFEVHVGRDELYYRLLEERDQRDFADEDASMSLRKAAETEYYRHPTPRPPFDEVYKTKEQEWLFALTTNAGQYEKQLMQDQVELAEECSKFLRDFPTSRYAANVLFIKARALDRRVDLREFRATKWVRCYDDFPCQASRNTWRMLAHSYPESPLAAAALLRLAQLDARAGDVDRAQEKLAELLAHFAPEGLPFGFNDVRASTEQGVFARQDPERSLDVPFDSVILEAYWLRDLLAQNRDPLYGYDPIGVPRRFTGELAFGLMHLHPRHQRYVENLERLKRRYPRCQLEDNIDLQIAKATPEPEVRVASLKELLERFPERDAVPEALYRLGMAYRELGDGMQAQTQFDRLRAGYPRSIWAQQAGRLPRVVGGDVHTETGA